MAYSICSSFIHVILVIYALFQGKKQFKIKESISILVLIYSMSKLLNERVQFLLIQLPLVLFKKKSLILDVYQAYTVADVNN